HVHVGEPSLFGAAAIELVEISRVGGGAVAALRRQADPEHRNAGALYRRNGRVDALDVGGFPFFGVEFVSRTSGAGGAPRLGLGRRRRLGIALHFSILLVGALLGLQLGVGRGSRRRWCGRGGPDRARTAGTGRRRGDAL